MGLLKITLATVLVVAASAAVDHQQRNALPRLLHLDGPEPR